MSDQQSKGLPTPSDGGQQTSVFGGGSTTPENPPTAEFIATEAGQRIASECAHLDSRGRLRIVATFRRQLITPGRPGRKRCKEITEAHADWKSGLRGVELYRKHIPGHERMGQWKREAKSRDLMDAIRSRERRATKQEHSDSGRG